MSAVLQFAPADAPRGRGTAGKSPSAKAGNGPQRPPTVLVVEDEVLVRMPVADYLRDCGYRVIEASNADEAVAMFEAAEPIEIVFSDVSMPGDMNGFALAKWVRRAHPDVKVILTSGVRNTAENAGDVCRDGPFLDKPYSVEALVAHIKRLLGG
jgi:DNA-binding NtrC family response regulator